MQPECSNVDAAYDHSGAVHRVSSLDRHLEPVTVLTAPS